MVIAEDSDWVSMNVKSQPRISRIAANQDLLSNRKDS
jgi:hypothetical protein